MLSFVSDFFVMPLQFTGVAGRVSVCPLGCPGVFHCGYRVVFLQCLLVDIGVVF